MPKTIDPSRPEPFGSYAAGSFYRSASAFSGVFMGCVTSGCRAAQEPLGSLCYVPPPNYVSSLAIWQIFPRVNESGLPVRKSALFWRFSHRVNGFCLGGAHGARHGKPSRLDNSIAFLAGKACHQAFCPMERFFSPNGSQ